MVMVEVFSIRLKINYVLNKFGDRGKSLLGVYKHLHEICYDVSFLPLDKFGQVTQISINVIV